MECPYCHQNMEKGIIYGDRHALKWIEESRDKGPVMSIFQKGIKLTDPYEFNEMETYYCKNCKKMIIDVSDKVD